ncbi:MULTISPECIES: VOC family protein [Burkholderia]|uniref:VOC family protein n=1 Tax=Burkholderia gladioli TaxID=28095 RepID=A0AB38TQ24_BURGA|nr:MULTISPECIES: VOC family protein [Burkholderia]KGE09201.1 lactoylglutathione lyase [Burkholderia gladioli]KVM63978.1 lactoylglutathione lyase [Burkholderia gladioli]MBJ9679383.1 VOC family protein [Burkholderia gladioli]MBU9265603.1 VOC family protein [Burkholderia gladioli]MBU9276241.1 VOC family protein [Burkholderia gladioli]
MAKLIHTMVRVRELDRSLAFYEAAFGLLPSHRLDFDDFSLVYLRNAEAEAELELTWNKGREPAYTHGDGYGHVAFVVDDAAGERARLISLGMQPRDLKEFRDGQGELIARFFFIEDPDGYKIEVLERHGHYR